MSELNHSSLQSIIAYQRKNCNLLRDSTEVLFGLDDVNKALVEELHSEIVCLGTSIGELKKSLEKLKINNDRIKGAMEKVDVYEKFLDDLRKQDDFLRLFQTPEKVATVVPRSASRAVNQKCLSVAAITYEEYEAVPFYVKGRVKVDEVNEFISSINTTLMKKSQILLSRCLKYEDKQLQFLYKQQERSCQGLTFFTEEDLKKFGFPRNTIPVAKLFSILRSTHRLKEVRSDGFVRFVVVEQ